MFAVVYDLAGKDPRINMDVYVNNHKEAKYCFPLEVFISEKPVPNDNLLTASIENI